MLTIDAAVLVASVEEVVFQNVQQSRHLAEDEDSGPSGLQPREELVKQHQLACSTTDASQAM